MKRPYVLALFALLVACSSDPQPEPIHLDFSNVEKIRIDTADLRIINRAEGTPRWAPYVGHQFQPTLSDALFKFVGDKVQASGPLGHATFVIKDATVTEQPLATSSDIGNLFTRQQGSKYIGRVEVTLEAQSPQDASVGMATAHAVYSVSLPENPTSYEKQEAYRKLLTTLLRDIDKELDKGIKTHLSRFLDAPPAQESVTPTRDSSLMSSPMAR